MNPAYLIASAILAIWSPAPEVSVEDESWSCRSTEIQEIYALHFSLGRVRLDDGQVELKLKGTALHLPLIGGLRGEIGAVTTLSVEQGLQPVSTPVRLLGSSASGSWDFANYHEIELSRREGEGRYWRLTLWTSRDRDPRAPGVPRLRESFLCEVIAPTP